MLIQCSTLVSIGARCAFGQSTLIADGYHRYRDPDQHWMEQGHDFRPIHIGDGAGVSDKCTIQSDVGERAMIASGSVVHRPIPPYCLAVGSPRGWFVTSVPRSVAMSWCRRGSGAGPSTDSAPRTVRTA